MSYVSDVTLPKGSVYVSRKKDRNLDAKARQLLLDPLSLYNAIRRAGKLGVVGEERNLGIVIVGGTSRTLPEPLSILLKGPSSGGKSNLVKKCLRLFPVKCIVDRAGISPKALAHGKVSLRHKIFYINELRSAKEAQLFLRLLQSEGKIEHEFTTVRGSARGTKTAKRVGTPVVLSTTTEMEIFTDDENRFLSSSMDVSPAQNRAINVARARTPRNPDVSDLPVWQKAMSLLVYTKGDFEHSPKWLEYVATKLPQEPVRVRRDWDRFLNFCSAVALWRSFGRKKPVDITFEDYCIAHRLLEPVLASTLESQRAQADVVSRAVGKLYKRLQRAVTVREVAKKLGWKRAVVYKHLKKAIKNHLVRYEDGNREQNVKPVLPIAHSGAQFLPSPQRVLRHYPELGKKVKYVDPLTGKWKAVRR